MALRRLRNLLHWRRETEFNNGEPASEPHVPINPLPRNRLIQQGFHAPYDFGMMREIVREQAGNLLQVARMPSGSITIARNSSDRPIHIGELCVVDPATGGVRPINPDEMEGIVNNPQNTVVASLEEVAEDSNFIRVRVQQGSLNLITGDSSGILADTISRIGEALQPIAEVVGGMTQPLAEACEQVINELAEGMVIPRGGGHPRIVQDISKYDKKYPHKCFQCKQILQYKHALGKAQEQGFTEEQHKKMWKSAIVEYYCCNCYSRKERGNNQYNGPFSSLTMLESIRRSMADAGRRWGIGPAENIEMIPQGHRCLRIINGNNEVLYQEEPRNIEPVFSTEVTHEIIEQQPYEELGIHIELAGGMVDGQRQYCNHSARRIVYTPLPDTQRDIHFVENFPHVIDNNKLVVIAQIYTQWFMKARTINIGYTEFPYFIRENIDRITRNPQYTITDYNSILQTCGRLIEAYFFQQDTTAIADYRERVLWRGYHIEQNQYNRVVIYGGIVDGERLEATVENQPEAGIRNTFIDNHPEIINQEELNNLAVSILNRNAPVGISNWHSEYEQNPVQPSIADCRHHEFNERGECLACGIHRVQLDQMRSTRLAEHHRMGIHNFEYINDEMLCRICRLSPMEIDANRSRQQVPRSRLF